MYSIRIVCTSHCLCFVACIPLYIFVHIVDKSSRIDQAVTGSLWSDRTSSYGTVNIQVFEDSRGSSDTTKNRGKLENVLNSYWLVWPVILRTLNSLQHEKVVILLLCFLAVRGCVIYKVWKQFQCLKLLTLLIMILFLYGKTSFKSGQVFKCNGIYWKKLFLCKVMNTEAVCSCCISSSICKREAVSKENDILNTI